MLVRLENDFIEEKIKIHKLKISYLETKLKKITVGH